MSKKNILITGSSQGIGLETAKYFASDYNVFITGRYEEKLKKLCIENKFAGYAAVDLYEENAALKLFKTLNIDFDILINNAGVYFYSGIEKMNHEDIVNSIKLNTLAPYELIKYILPHMKRQKWGRIINIGSISGVMGEANASIYSMTKASLIGLTKSLALELAQDNITVNIINPGWVDTELINNANLEEDFSKNEIIETIPQRRFVTPEEIAQTCNFLISGNASSITGQSVNICAGLSLGF
ncbi:MAG: SDR family oxidoreductase [Candidatus Gastranaerophilales bacterium]|nr:SDR family oxidoreductase [Candidatus Gastranaerophilales bacterium]